MNVTARTADGGTCRVGDDVRDAMRDDAGLAAARAGQNQQRSFGVGDRFALLRVQAFEEIHEERETRLILTRSCA